MAFSKIRYRKCRSCGKIFPALIGDCFDGNEVYQLIHPICDQCREKETKSILDKLFKKDST